MLRCVEAHVAAAMLRCVEAHVAAARLVFEAYSLSNNERKLIVGRFDHEGHQVQYKPYYTCEVCVVGCTERCFVQCVK